MHWNFLYLLIIYICLEKTCYFDHITMRILVVVAIGFVIAHQGQQPLFCPLLETIFLIGRLPLRVVYNLYFMESDIFLHKAKNFPVPPHWGLMGSES